MDFYAKFFMKNAIIKEPPLQLYSLNTTKYLVATLTYPGKMMMEFARKVLEIVFFFPSEIMV
jgi:hypothetical protein